MNKILENKTVFYIDQIRNIENGGFELPVTCEIDPSNACNLSCSFCMYKNRPRNKSLSWDSYCWALDELKSIGVKSITFTGGGEPMMSSRINDMAQRADVMGFELGLITNGTLIHKLQYPEIFKFIRISLDAGNREIYEKVKGKDLFNQVIENIKNTKANIGLSFVITDVNKNSMEEAKELAKELGVMYIQFKPDSRYERQIDWNSSFGENAIFTDRYKAEDLLPCKVASLIGVIGADEVVYFCCQYRGNKNFALGKLKEAPLEEIFKRRDKIQPDISKCPQCRYMNYVVSYKEIIKGGLLFFDHRNFL